MQFIPHENTILIFGGRKSKNADADMNDLWEYDIERKEWHESNKGQDQDKGPHAIMTIKNVLQMTDVTKAFKKAHSILHVDENCELKKKMTDERKSNKSGDKTPHTKGGRSATPTKPPETKRQTTSISGKGPAKRVKITGHSDDDFSEISRVGSNAGLNVEESLSVTSNIVKIKRVTSKV